ncbi:hypothetical protein K4039_01485 [Lyngbya sp. CCAP 1446/10]|uniref:hypothetical protein n=1 Tax=Lyngbya sp. CCAP 1446/10 TaxID=439293 RepID=UPI0022386C00|nr:hypothetical protein [Lyngbya sp. CCAP 1446/10]MCW6048784.1 hypothetical protein [Lyngbya sp. CCAP 1446/10]
MNDYNRQIQEEEQLLYNHWLELVQVEQPIELIDRFRTLFIHGNGYGDRTIAEALEKIAASPYAQQEFKYILNRCCHILINRWQTYPSKQAAIPELIALFEEAPKILGYSRSRVAHSIPKLVNQFTESEQYLTLQRLAKVITHSNEDSSNSKTPATLALGTLIPRYPYLYKHCLLSDDSTYEQQKIIKKIQTQKQQQFEIDLSQYVAHQVRKAQTARRETSMSFVRNIQTIKNPTLLSDPELFFALKQFVGKVEGADTYRQLAGRFMANTSTTVSYSSFKDDLYEYLISSVTDDRYGKRQFNEKLYKKLQNTFPHNDAQNFNEFLMIRTCSQLLNFLVVESPARPNHFVFIDLISNIGPTQTTGLLLKIVLICSKVKAYLEKRLAILFGHYEFSTREGVVWLVKALENLNLALSTNFGNLDVSFLR